MDAARWARVQAQFVAALEHPAEARAEYVERSEPDPDIRARVLQLLEADADPATVLAGTAEDLLPPLPNLELGIRVGPYRLIERIAEGGMGTVHLAMHAELEHRVAVKLIKRGMDTEEIVRRFAGERRILAHLEHPNIARLLDGGVTDDGRPWFSMEYVDGEPIDAYCEKRRLPVRQRLALFASVCDAVQFAHTNLVVHRDLKPSNIMVAAGGTVKLLDFGIAKVVGGDASDASPDLTRTGLRPMSPGYAAPEQVLGLPITTATDVYALGVVLYRLLAGRGPYGEQLKTVELEGAIVKTTPAPPRNMPGAATSDPDIDNIALMALRKEPERRYESAGNLAQDVRRYLSGHPVRATRDSVGYRTRKFVRRHKAGVAATVVGLLSVGGSSAYYTSRLASERDHARAEAAKAEQVAQFLTDLFAISDPSRARGASITAREMLDRGAQRITAELSAQPDVQADLMDLIGNVYFGLGLYDAATPLLTRALETRRRVHGETHAEVARTLNALGVAQRLRADYIAAESLAAQGLAIQRRLFGVEHIEVAHSLADLAEALRVSGKLEAAEPMYRDALAMRIRFLGQDHVDVADTRNNLALTLHGRGDYAGAAALHRSALATRRQLLGEKHIDVANSYDNLALALTPLGEYAESERLAREAIRLNTLLLGATEPRTLRVQARLARTLLARGDAAGAERLLRPTLAQQRERLGENHTYIAHSLSDLARIRQARGDRTGADTLYRRALAIERKLLAPTSPLLAESLVGLGSLLIDTNRCADGLVLLEEALRIRRRSLIDRHAETGEAASLLGACLMARRSYADAEPLVVDGFEMLQAGRGATHPATLAALRRVIDLYAAWGRTEQEARFRALLSSS
jgi:serine/threonine-protein kinase